MKVCYTALFGNYEELKEPTIISDGWRYVCFTDQPLKSDVWEIVPIKITEDAQVMARWYKIMGWIDWQYSMWIDASFQINKDLNDWWNERFISPFSCASHPLRNDVYAEGRNCIINGRGNADDIQRQMIKYEKAGFPANQGIITSGILLRENTQENIDLHEKWWKELTEGSTRDQISFAYVSLGIDWVNTYKWDYSQSKEFKYHKHFKHRQ